MHIATSLSRLGKRGGVIDLDMRQQTLRRYYENRQKTLNETGVDSLPTPEFMPLPKIAEDDVPEGKTIHDLRLTGAVEQLSSRCDFILLDCPGSHTRMAQMAHAMADTLVTPMNDSFIDFDLLAQIDTDGETIIGPSVYAEMVWSARQTRVAQGFAPLDWVVVRNRVGPQQMVNKLKLERALEKLSKRIGFRLVQGFSERVVFRELFPRGLTLLDLRDVGVRQLNISNVAARQELRDLVRALNLPDVEVTF